MDPQAEDVIPVLVTPSAWSQSPRVHTLIRRQMEFVLSRNHVGRVAFVTDYRIEIRPVHYVYYAGALYGRTALETKGVTWLVRPDVVVEVDEIEGLFAWRSVIVRGQVTLLHENGSREERSAYWTAVDAIRTLVPAAFTERDPMPHMNIIFRIDAEELTGREASVHSGR